jgi:hypothetical protein
MTRSTGPREKNRSHFSKSAAETAGPLLARVPATTQTRCGDPATYAAGLPPTTNPPATTRERRGAMAGNRLTLTIGPGQVLCIRSHPPASSVVTRTPMAEGLPDPLDWAGP